MRKFILGAIFCLLSTGAWATDAVVSEKPSDINDYPEFMTVAKGLRLPVVGELGDKVIIKLDRVFIQMKKMGHSSDAGAVPQACRLGEAQDKFKDKDLKGIAKIYEDCAALAGENPRVLQATGLLKMVLGQADEAMRYLEQAVALDPFDLNLIENFGDALCLSGDQRKCFEQYQQVIAGNPVAETRVRQKMQTIAGLKAKGIAEYLIVFNGISFQEGLPVAINYLDSSKNHDSIKPEDYLYKNSEMKGGIAYIDFQKYLDQSDMYVAYRNYQTKKVKELMNETAPLEIRALKEIRGEAGKGETPVDWNEVMDRMVRGQSGLFGALDKVRSNIKEELKGIAAELAAEKGYKAVISSSGLPGAKDITKKAIKLYKKKNHSPDFQAFDQWTKDSSAQVVLRKKLDMKAFFTPPTPLNTTKPKNG